MQNDAKYSGQKSKNDDSMDVRWPEGRFAPSVLQESARSKKDIKWWERLGERLLELNWTKAVLSRRAGVAYDSVNKYLRGTVDKPRGDILEKLSKAVGRDTRWLLFGDNSRLSFEDFTFKDDYRCREGVSIRMADTRQILDSKINYPAMDNFTQSNFLTWEQLPRFSDFECGFERFSSRRVILRQVIRDRFFTLPVPDDKMAPVFKMNEALVFEVAAVCQEDDYAIVSMKSDDSLHLRRLHLSIETNSVSLKTVLWSAVCDNESADVSNDQEFKIIGKLILHLPGVVLRPAHEIST